MSHLTSHDYAVIIAGGTGTRLWPLSRKTKPKQFNKLVNDESTLQLMYRLLQDAFPKERIFVQVIKDFVPLVHEQLPTLPAENILAEPMARDTAAAFGFCTSLIVERDPEATIGYFYADHVIHDGTPFIQSIETAFQSVADHPNHIVMIGVKPTFPHTGLGYIQMDKEVNHYDSGDVFSVETFIEKPDEKRAAKLVRSWAYLWNTGYKVIKGNHFFDIIGNADPEFVAKLKQIGELLTQPNTQNDVEAIFATLPKLSFEYLIVEKVKNLLVVPSDMDWTDIGDWSSLHDILSQKEGQHMITRGDYVNIDSEQCLVYGHDRLIATVGLKNVIVVDTGDVVLVMNKDQSQKIKNLVGELEATGHAHLL